MAVETVVMDDRELFSAAVANEPAETPPEQTQEQQQPEPQEQPRDEQGRFASRQEEPAKPAPTVQEQQPQPQQVDTDGQVPSWRLKELREARDAAAQRAEQAGQEAYAMRQQMAAMQRELAQLKAPKQEPVDFFQNPEAALAQRINPFEQRLEQFESNMRLNMSRTMAIAMHGRDAVTEMEAAVEAAMQSGHPEMPLLAAQMRASDDPAAVAMTWYQRDKLMRETGGDLTAYRTKLQEDALKDPAFLAKAVELARAQANSQAPNSRPNVQLPPSLNKASGSGVSSSDLSDNDMSNAALFQNATAGMRR